MGLWEKWKEARRERQRQRESDRQVLRAAWHDLTDGKLQDDFQKARRQFYRREWTPETARLELDKIGRALKRQEATTHPGDAGPFGQALLEFVHGLATGSEETAYTLFPKADLLAMTDFLEERIKQKCARPSESKLDRIAAMRKEKARHHEQFADDPVMQETSDRYWDDKIMKAMEQNE